MTLQWPVVLWGLLLVPLAALAYVMFNGWRRRSARRFATRDMEPNVVPLPPGWRRHVPAAVYLLAMVSLVIAIGRPEAAFSVPRERATVVLVMDASASMNAPDIDPNRLEAARRAAGAFLDQLPEKFRVGVVSFASRAQILSRPTTDRAAVMRSLVSLETTRGTAIGDAIARALEAPSANAKASPRQRRVPMVALLLSDGNNTTGRSPLAAARSAREQGVRVYTVALGNSEGSGSSRAGRPVTPPDEEILRRIAGITGGRFFSAPSGEDLEEVYRDLGSSILRVREEQEVTVAFLGAALVLLAIGGALSTLWFNRLP